MKEMPEHKFGYLLLKDKCSKKGIYVKANKIVRFCYNAYDDVLIYVKGSEVPECVLDTIDEILEQMENIHPSLR